MAKKNENLEAAEEKKDELKPLEELEDDFGENEEEFDIEIPAETAEQVTTVEDAVEMIKNAVN